MKTPQTDRIMISDKKFEILRLRVKGYPLGLIASQLKISKSNVKYNLKNIMERIDCARKGEHRLICQRY